MTIEILKFRLRTVERRSARLSMVLFLAIVPAVAAILATVSSNLWADAPQPAVHDIVRAHRIEFVAAGGKLRAGLRTLNDRSNQTSTGLALVSNGKDVLRLVMRSFNDVSLNSANLIIVDPEDMREHAVRSRPDPLHPWRWISPRTPTRWPRIEVHNEGGSEQPGVAVHIDNLSYASAPLLHAEKDHSATLSRGRIFKPFSLRAIAEADKPRFEVEKDGEITAYGFVQ